MKITMTEKTTTIEADARELRDMMSDLISRLSEIRSNYNCFDENEEPYYRALSEAIQLASAQPERTGKWKVITRKENCLYYACSECKLATCIPRYVGFALYEYCPNCGAKM